MDERSTEFSPESLAIGIGSRDANQPHAFVAFGRDAIDLAVLAANGFLRGTGCPDECFAQSDLNDFLAAGQEVWSKFRNRVAEMLNDVLTGSSNTKELSVAIVHQDQLTMHLPTMVGDFVDFYSSIHHATNLGRMFRPDSEPLLPNWRHIPIGYHGRSATLMPDKATIRRPHGIRLIDGAPVFGPSLSLDFELEVGFVVGPGNNIGEPINIEDAKDHIFGICLVNDWSARDIQAFEYQPLGPFLGKSFATSVSPWITSLAALEPYRIPSPHQDPIVAKYLSTRQNWGLALELEVLLSSTKMRREHIHPAVISTTRFDEMYWTPAQQLAHLTVNGAKTRPGDLFASGTVSGSTPGSEGSLIELTHRGTRPLHLPDGSERSFLLDGDEVTLRGWANNGSASIYIGEVSATIAKQDHHSNNDTN